MRVHVSSLSGCVRICHAVGCDVTVKCAVSAFDKNELHATVRTANYSNP
jgi:hypothetical protein